jgi:hypothetical protein
VDAHQTRPAMCLLSLVVLAVLALPASARSGERSTDLSPITVGSRIRLSAPVIISKKVQGTVAEINMDSLVVVTDGQARLSLPTRAITQLEVSTGRHRKTLSGMAIGAATGVALSVVLPKCVIEGCTSDVGFDPTFALLGALGGSMWGAMIGSFVTADRWTLVSRNDVRLMALPSRGRGVGLALSVSLK